MISFSRSAESSKSSSAASATVGTPPTSNVSRMMVSMALKNWTDQTFWMPVASTRQVREVDDLRACARTPGQGPLADFGEHRQHVHGAFRRWSDRKIGRGEIGGSALDDLRNCADLDVLVGGISLETHPPDARKHRFLNLHHRAIRQSDDAGDLAFAEHVGNEVALEIVEIAEPEQLRRRIAFLTGDGGRDLRQQLDRIWAALGKRDAIERSQLGKRPGSRQAAVRSIETFRTDRKHTDRLLGTFGRDPETRFHRPTSCVCWGMM